MTKLKALLTLDEAATDLAVSKTTLRRWITVFGVGGLGSAADTAKEVPTEDQSYPNPGRFGHLGNLRMLILMLKIAALRPSLPMESANSHSAMQSYNSAYATS